MSSDPFDAWVVRRDDSRAPVLRDGSLRGVRFGVKDIVDVAGFPTAYGVDFASRHPEVDAWCVSALRAAGAVVAGKTRTTPFAYRDPAATRNPRNPAHTPGGSSAGSAAAVASGDVPLAIGTQTLGSILRPAAYCGIVGFKPTFGKIPVSGVSPFAPSLDTIGFLAADVATARRASEALFALDPGTQSPRIGIALDYMSSSIEPATRAAIASAVERLRAAGFRVVAKTLPACFEESAARAALVQSVEGAIALGDWIGEAALPASLSIALRQGREVDPDVYRATLRWREANRGAVAALFEEVDAVVLPAANLAPGIESTGDPSPLSPATFFGLPAVALPIALDAASGLPFSLQLIGAVATDGLLLDTAGRLESAIAFSHVRT